MAALYVPISLSVLEWLIHKAEVSGNTSAYDLLKKWQHGKKQATFHQIEGLSKKCRFLWDISFCRNRQLKRVL